MSQRQGLLAVIRRLNRQLSAKDAAVATAAKNLSVHRQAIEVLKRRNAELAEQNSLLRAQAQGRAT